MLVFFSHLSYFPPKNTCLGKFNLRVPNGFWNCSHNVWCSLTTKNAKAAVVNRNTSGGNERSSLFILGFISDLRTEYVSVIAHMNSECRQKQHLTKKDFYVWFKKKPFTLESSSNKIWWNVLISICENIKTQKLWIYLCVLVSNIKKEDSTKRHVLNLKKNSWTNPCNVHTVYRDTQTKTCA